MKKIIFYSLIFWCLSFGLVFAQTKSQDKTKQDKVLKGTVTHEVTGETLEGIKVSLKGTNISTTTNRDGKYELKIPASTKDVILVFSYEGYKTVQKEGEGDIRMKDEE